MNILTVNFLGSYLLGIQKEVIEWLSLTLNFSLTSICNSDKFYWITFKPTEAILLSSSLHLNLDLMLSLLGFPIKYTENLSTNINSKQHVLSKQDSLNIF